MKIYMFFNSICLQKSDPKKPTFWWIRSCTLVYFTYCHTRPCMQASLSAKTWWRIVRRCTRCCLRWAIWRSKNWRNESDCVDSRNKIYTFTLTLCRGWTSSIRPSTWPSSSLLRNWLLDTLNTTSTRVTGRYIRIDWSNRFTTRIVSFHPTSADWRPRRVKSFVYCVDVDYRKYPPCACWSVGMHIIVAASTVGSCSRSCRVRIVKRTY